MISVIRIRNTSGQAGRWLGVTIENEASYDIGSYIEYLDWLKNKGVALSLSLGDLTLNDGFKDVKSFLDLRPADVSIVEEFTPSGMPPTGGHFQAQSYHIDIDHAQGTWKDVDVSFPFPVTLTSAQWHQTEQMDGDKVQVLVSPDYEAGNITANLSPGGSVISVEPDVLNLASVGKMISVSDGVNTDDLGRIIGIDEENLLLTVETPTTNAFVASAPTVILITTAFVPGICLCGQGHTALAKDVVGGSYLPPNSILRVRYQNNEGTTTGKGFVFILEYKY